MAADTPTPITYDSEKSAKIVEEDKQISSFPLGITAGDIQIVPVDQMFQK
jgi:hypothetical protein